MNLSSHNLPAHNRFAHAKCTRCPRLAAHLADIRNSHPSYHAAPVPAFGPEDARLFIVGLAPGMHGANRTGRPFTGDHAGILLYATLHAFGFANQASCVLADGAVDYRLALHDCRISNAVKCLPPQNKPLSSEIRTCNAHLRAELAAASGARALLALGTVAHLAVLTALGLSATRYPFAHGARHDLADGRVLFDSYHCSRYNTQTRRLTESAFHDIFRAIHAWLATAH